MRDKRKMMMNDFYNEYAMRSDAELLQLASDRASLTDEAVAALDAELSRRHLDDSDKVEHERFVKRNAQRESRRRRKVFGTRGDRESWVDIFVNLFWSVVVISLISLAYQALPSRYHFTPDWQEAAVNVMIVSVFIAVSSDSWRRKCGFWLSLLASSSIHLALVHAWIAHTGTLSGRDRRGYGKLAALLGLLLFFLVYGSMWLLQRKFCGEETGEE